MSTIITPTPITPGSLPQLSAADFPDESKLISDDGQPVDSIFAEKQMRLLTEPLYASWKGPQGDGRFVAMANVGLYFTGEDPLVPDALLSVDVTTPPGVYTKEVRSYLVWRFGKSPDVVIEIVSGKVGGEDTDKLEKYSRWGIPYYVIFDPEHYLSDESLRIFAMMKGRYRKVEEPYLENVGLSLTLWKGQFEHVDQLWLRWCDLEGDPILTGAEKAESEYQRAESVNQKLQAEKQKLRVEQRKVEAEVQKVAKLEALLKEHGIDPGQL